MGALEALQALGQVGRSARGEQATADVIEVSTDFTIGGAIEQAAAELASFWESQAPCAEVTVEGAVATIDYGTLDDGCSWHGHTYAGISQVGVASVTPGELEVEHAWIGLTNGETAVDGEATVTWSGDDLTRRVVTEHTWTDEATGETVDVRGDHVTGRIDDGVPVWQSGFTLDGTRDWTVHEGAARGEWALEMDGLELMLIDPAPQAGTASVTAPSGRSLNIEYARVDDDTISATLSPLRGGDRVYHISRLGAVEEAD
jgi:hypothetical protein